VEEELWRSIPVYFVSFLVIGALDYTEYVQISGIATFVLAFIVTVIHFKLMVGYRKKEYLTDPSISSITNHMLKRQKPEVKNTGYKELSPNFRPILTVLIIAYLVFRYAV
jgi:phosphoglycerol transferase MdoB-like AlkP superfamily enzyme